MPKKFMDMTPEERRKEWIKRWKKGVSKKADELDKVK